MKIQRMGQVQGLLLPPQKLNPKEYRRGSLRLCKGQIGAGRRCRTIIEFSSEQREPLYGLQH